MKRISPSKDWRPSWKKSYQFDLLEVYGERPKLGYSLLYKLRSSIIIKSISRYLQRGSSILEIAAAQGNFSIRLSEMGYMVTWNDIRTDLIGYVKLKDELAEILNEADYMKEKEVRFHRKAERINVAAVWWPVLQIGILVLTAVLQVQSLKNYFQAKNLY